MRPTVPTFERSQTALLALVGVNLIPLLGVVQWDWSVFEIVFLYWCENLILGLMTVLKMVCSAPDISQGGMKIEIPGKGTARRIPLPENLPGNFMLLIKLFLIPFFLIHYGMFCMGHGTFIFAIFADDTLGTGELTDALAMLQGPLLMVCGALLASHLYSFLANYIGAGEFRRTNPMMLMMAPYKRIVILHLTIIFGAGLTMFLGSPFWLLAVLILLKIGMDVRAHLQERKRFAAGAEHPPVEDTVISNLA
jgi:hypothetical protein